MSVSPAQTPVITHVRHLRPYRRCTVEELANLIVVNGDASAIREVCDHRYLCRVKGGKPLRPPEYVQTLNDSARMRHLFHHNPEGCKRVYDETVDMLWNLPADRRSGGRDCRKFYSMFLHCLDHRGAGNAPGGGKIAPIDPLLAGIQESQVFQRCLTLGHYFACREALRSFDQSRSRYTWTCYGGQLIVWMPKSMTGGQRRKSLEELVPDVDARRPSEPQRVQAIVDQTFPRARLMPLDAVLGLAAPAPDLGRLFQLDGLAEILAWEKAMFPDELRPSIRRLAPVERYQLTLCLFDHLLTDKSTHKDLARRFGLSTTAISHYGSDEWQVESGKPPPDLYANLAELLASDDDFQEAAKAAQIWDRVQATLDLIPSRKRKGAGYAG